MATPSKRFAQALSSLKELQDQGLVGIHTTDIPSVKHRQLLVKNGYLSQVTKGWYIATNPAEKNDEASAWYLSYWAFIAGFLNRKYGKQWSLSPEQSLLLHAKNHCIPQQLFIRSPRSNNKPTPLPHNTSLFNLKADLPPTQQVVMENGIRMYNLQASLVYAGPSLYTKNPIDVRTALSMIRDASELLPILLENGHTTLAGRLAGAFRNIKRGKIADQIIETFKQADYDIREQDPFDTKLEINLPVREPSPYVNRIRLIWQQMRGPIIANFPQAPGIDSNHESYLKNVDDLYITDAYHSLSIERYRVTPELIQRVSFGQWNIEKKKAERKQADAMAARGYYQAFQSVKQSIKAILDGANAGSQAINDHATWYRQLFDPSVVAGLLKTSGLSGYRSNQVFIGNSKHVPLKLDAMADAMPVLFELLEEEPEASVGAVLGHFVFVFIHPYMDGNGRMARFLFNTMLASGGYPWTVIPVDKRDEYMQALEEASVRQNIEPFAKFLGKLVSQSMEGQNSAGLPIKK